MWIQKKKFVEMCQLVRDAGATSKRSTEVCNRAAAQVEQLVALNTRLLIHLRASPDYQLIIDQANEDSVRADRFKEENDFLSGLLRIVCAK